MALPLDDLVTWLGANGITNVGANWMPTAPDAQVIVSGVAGGTPLIDGAFESGHFHIRVRATTDKAAETQALAIHSLIGSLTGSLTMGSTHVASIAAASGQPTFLLRDSSERTTYLATYLAITPVVGS